MGTTPLSRTREKASASGRKHFQQQQAGWQGVSVVDFGEWVGYKLGGGPRDGAEDDLT